MTTLETPNGSKNLAFLEKAQTQKLEQKANLDIVTDSTMKAVRGVTLPDEALSMLSLEFHLATRHPGESQFFNFVAELIKGQTEGRNLENWESFLFKNLVLFTQINDFEVVLTEFASEEYCSSIRRILLFALESMGLQAFISFRHLPGAIQEAHRERLWREVGDAGSKQQRQSRQNTLKKLSFSMPWRETSQIRKIARMMEKEEILEIFERDEGQVVFDKLDEDEAREQVWSNLRAQMDRILGKKRFHNIFGDLGVDEQTLWLRDYIKSEFFGESDLDQIRRDLITTQTQHNPLRLSRLFNSRKRRADHPEPSHRIRRSREPQ